MIVINPIAFQIAATTDRTRYHRPGYWRRVLAPTVYIVVGWLYREVCGMSRRVKEPWQIAKEASMFTLPAEITVTIAGFDRRMVADVLLEACVAEETEGRKARARSTRQIRCFDRADRLRALADEITP